MITLVNNVEDKVIGQFDNLSDLLEKMKQISLENEDDNWTFIGLGDVIEYVDDYCDNLTLIID
jgi:hypothetical protein